MGKFVVKETKTGFVFNLKAGNGEVIAVSEVYSSEAACMKGIESVRKNSVDHKLPSRTSTCLICRICFPGFASISATNS